MCSDSAVSWRNGDFLEFCEMNFLFTIACVYYMCQVSMKYVFVLSLCFASLLWCSCHAAEEKMSYWQVQRKGANFFNKTPSEEWFIAAKDAGIHFARLAPDKWHCEQRDFLLGNADAFQEISHPDFQKLKTTLDQAHRHDIKVVVTLLSLPGARWKQNNHNQKDFRIWQSKEYQAQAILFWKKLACLLKDHPAVVGYNILNEPHPERVSGIGDFGIIDFQKWYKSVTGSCADLNLFYQQMVKTIREVDAHTPIIVDVGLCATPWAISYLTPINDPGVIYSFHMYEPEGYTTKRINNSCYQYPGTMPILLEDAERTIYWDKNTLKEFLEPVSAWQSKYRIPSSQILVGEFGCDRTAQGADKYLNDLIQVFNANKWHWAFYSFREDCWDAMDYELGPRKLDWDYWSAIEQGISIDPFRHNNCVFDVIKKGLQLN